MNGLNGKPTEYPENALVPYPVILAASKGDPDAVSYTHLKSASYQGCRA